MNLFLKFKKMRTTKSEVINIILKKLNFFIFLFFIPFNFNHYLHAHMRGTFSSEQDALNRSLELGCDGIHNKQDKWLPCENKKELHKYLRK